MGRLTARLDRLERRRPRRAICPEHATETPHLDYRAGLAPFMPPEMRADCPAPEVPPPCGRCGWRWEPAFDVRAADDWGRHEPV